MNTQDQRKSIVFFCVTKNWGGLEKNVRLRAEYFGKKGYQVQVVLFQNIFRERYEGLKNVTVKSVNKRGGDLNISVVLAYIKILKKAKADAIFCPIKKDWWLVTLAASLAGVPNKVLYLGNKLKIRKGLKYGTVFNVLKPKMIVNCQDLKNHLLTTTNYFGDHNLFQIYTGIELPSREGEAFDFRKKLNLGPNAFIVGCIGWLNYRKGFDLLPLIAKKLPDNIHFVHVGKGGFDLDMEKILEENNQVRHRIHLLGQLPPSKMEQFYRGIDLFLLTSRSESLANVLNESMGFGIPIVATKAPGSAEIIADNRYGILTEIEDVGAMAKGIAAIANQDVTIDPLVQRKRMKDHFSLEGMMKQYEKIIFDLD